MMATNEPPGCSDFLLPALSLPMKEERSRNKERLEASLAGLCELELLKQRQESRVQSALRLGDSLLSGQSPWGQLRSALFSLDAPKDATADDRRHQTVGCARDRCSPLLLSLHIGKVSGSPSRPGITDGLCVCLGLFNF